MFLRASFIISLLLIVLCLSYVGYIEYHTGNLQKNGAEVIDNGYENFLFSWKPYSARFANVDLSNTDILNDVVDSINASGVKDVQLFRCNLNDGNITTLLTLKKIEMMDLRGNDIDGDNMKKLVDNGGVSFVYTADFQYPEQHFAKVNEDD